jgi:predicted nuclease of restriction endonuclease-like (RecB) superfamily
MDDLENIDKVYNRVSDLILSAQSYLTKTINTSMVVLYWHIGKTIQENEIKNNRAEYGKETVRRLAENLQREYGKGYSYSNLTRMITLYNNFPEESILNTVLTKLSWSHLIEIIKQKEELKREFYITMCINEGWSVRELS